MVKSPPAGDQILAEVEDLLRSMPPKDSFAQLADEHLSWLGRAQSVISAWNSIEGILFTGVVDRLHTPSWGYSPSATVGVILTALHRARHDSQMRTGGSLTMAVDQGQVFNYFDQVLRIILQAKTDILFVDPYLDADFVTRYLPHVGGGVSVRLMARERVKVLVPAVEMYRQQNQCMVEVRSVSHFHDRYIFVDHVAGFQSGASFADGARRRRQQLCK